MTEKKKNILDEPYDEKFGVPLDEEPFARIVGSGIYNLDTIVFDGKVTIEEVGGTCGNVMCMLANLGLETYPQACLDDSPEGFKVKADLDEDDVVYILTEAQHFASESISYMGTKGGTLIGAKSLKFEEPCNIPPDKE